jgi:hypothetical protein
MSGKTPNIDLAKRASTKLWQQLQHGYNGAKGKQKQMP